MTTEKTKAMRKALAALSLTASLVSAGAPIRGNVEHIQSVSQPSQSYERLNAFYGLPKDVNGYTFVEFYHDGTAFGKTNLSKKIAGPLMAMSQIRSINEGLTDAGIGLKAVFPFSKGSVSAYAVPAWINHNGHSVKNRSIVGVSVSKNLTDKLTVGAFGEMNFDAQSGNEWCYGEAFAAYKLDGGKWTLVYNPALRNKSAGQLVPKVEHRFALQRGF